jgi:HEPN domain-containing protein
MLKAVLVARGQPVSRTHDLVALLAEAVDAGGALRDLEVDCRLLSPYAVLLRYPGPMPEPTEREGREAAAAADRIYTRVLELPGVG